MNKNKEVASDASADRGGETMQRVRGFFERAQERVRNAARRMGMRSSQHHYGDRDEGSSTRYEEPSTNRRYGHREDFRGASDQRGWGGMRRDAVGTYEDDEYGRGGYGNGRERDPYATRGHYGARSYGGYGGRDDEYRPYENDRGFDGGHDERGSRRGMR